MTLILLALTFLRRKIWDEAGLCYIPFLHSHQNQKKRFMDLFSTISSTILSNYLVSGFLIPLSDVC